MLFFISCKEKKVETNAKSEIIDSLKQKKIGILQNEEYQYFSTTEIPNKIDEKRSKIKVDEDPFLGDIILFVESDKANIRYQPDVNSEIIGQVNSGTTLELLAVKKAEKRNWLFVNVDFSEIEFPTNKEEIAKKPEKIAVWISSNTTSQNYNTMNENEIKKIKKHQKLQENYVSDGIADDLKDETYQLNSEDFSIISMIIAEGLRMQGFQKKDSNEFRSNIESIFGEFNPNKENNDFYLIDDKNDVAFVFVDAFHVYNKETDTWNPLKNTDELIDYHYNQLTNYSENGASMISFDKSILLDNFLISDLITFNEKDYKIHIPNKIINRNLYFLNNNKSRLPSLISDDFQFLQNLLLKFSYVKDSKITKAVFDTCLSENKEMIGVICFGLKSKNKNVLPQEEFLNFVVKNDSLNADKNNLYLPYCKSLLAFLNNYIPKHPDEFEDEMEKSEIISKTLETILKTENENSFKTHLIFEYIEENPKEVEMIKENEYFGNELLKDYIKNKYKEQLEYNKLIEEEGITK